MIATRLDTRARLRAQFHDEQRFKGSGVDFALGLLIAFVVSCVLIGIWL